MCWLRAGNNAPSRSCTSIKELPAASNSCGGSGGGCGSSRGAGLGGSRRGRPRIAWGAPRGWVKPGGSLLAPCQAGCILCTAAGVPQTGVVLLPSAPRGGRSRRRKGGYEPRRGQRERQGGTLPGCHGRRCCPAWQPAWGRDRACGFPPLGPCLRRVSPRLPGKREPGLALGAPSSRAGCRSGAGRGEDRVPVGTRLGRPSPTPLHRPPRVSVPASSPTMGLWGHPGEGRACCVPLSAPLTARGRLGC